jgi:hypothetical protein
MRDPAPTGRHSAKASMKGKPNVKKLICALAMALVCAPVSAAAPPENEWTKVSSDHETTFYIRDKDWHLGRPGDTSVFVWYWVDYHRDARRAHGVHLLEINCVAEAYRIVRTNKYDHRGVATTGTEPSRWDFATPGSVIEGMVRLTCAAPDEGDFW